MNNERLVQVHDIEVTNKDECVTVKSPSSNILVCRSRQPLMRQLLTR